MRLNHFLGIIFTIGFDAITPRMLARPSNVPSFSCNHTQSLSKRSRDHKESLREIRAGPRTHKQSAKEGLDTTSSWRMAKGAYVRYTALTLTLIRDAHIQQRAARRILQREPFLLVHHLRVLVLEALEELRDAG